MYGTFSGTKDVKLIIPNQIKEMIVNGKNYSLCESERRSW